MTSEVPDAKRDAQPVAVIDVDEQPSCLCCLHFAVDFDNMPELQKNKRPSRQPKRNTR